MVLRSAEMSGLSFPRAAYEGAIAWFDEVTDLSFRAGYTAKGTGKVYAPGLNELFDHHETMTAFRVIAKLAAGAGKSDFRNEISCKLLLRDKPQWDGYAIDFYYWHHATLALHDVLSGEAFTEWRDAMVDVLVKNQHPLDAGCKAGSWDPVDRWGKIGGRVYATAINAMTLGMQGMMRNVFQQPAPKKSEPPTTAPSNPVVPPMSWEVKFYGWEFRGKDLPPSDWESIIRKSPLDTLTTDRIDFLWGQGPPTPKVPADYFATVATTTTDLDAGKYEMSTVSDDGVRVWIDGQRIIDNWTWHVPTRDAATVTLAKGRHVIRIEHFEISGVAQLQFSMVPTK
jgi:hypothetical protein